MRIYILAAAGLLLNATDYVFAQSPAPPGLSASARCSEHFTKKPTVLAKIADIRASGGGYVVATYELDGSGRASDVRIVESVPPGKFDAAVIEALQKSEFTPSVKASECRFVSEFYRVKRTAH